MSNAPSPISCSDVPLELILSGDESTSGFGAAAGHVETCADCQHRLTQLAAEESDWQEIRTMLGDDSSTFSTHSPAAEELNGSPLSQGLDFLAPPSHPEMLGRLGRYEIEHVIGSGGMGVVLRGFDTELNRPVAIKVMAPHLAHCGAARQRFAREARSAAAIVHEHVVAIHDVKTDDKAPYLVMQFIPGESLQHRVDRDGPLAPNEILRIGMQAAAGLAAAHEQGVIHRDVKPGNILLENGVERALLTDFGLARAADDATLTRSGILAGTPHYMSPEQACGGDVDARSDLFSLGAVLYFMATGHPPFRAERAMAVLHRICNDKHRPVQQVNATMPDGLAHAIDRLLQKKPGRRFATAREVQQFLGQALFRQQQPRLRARRLFASPTRRRVVGACAATAALGMTWLAVSMLGGVDLTNDASPDSAPSGASAVVADRLNQDGEFQHEIADITANMARVAQAPYPESLAIRAEGSSWQGAVGAVETELSHLESLWSSGTEPRSFNTPLGESR
jgi:hypothetical protein